MQKCGMNKTPKSKAENLAAACKNAVYRIHLVAGATSSDKEYLDIAEKILIEALAEYHTDIITRMEAMQQRFGRLQLEDTPPEPERAFDGEDAEEWQRRSEKQGAE